MQQRQYFSRMRLLMSLFVMFTALTAWAGNCGPSLDYSYDSNTHTLTITGSGEMYDFSGEQGSPWETFKTEITTVVFPSGITSIGKDAFSSCTGLSSVTIPASVVTIDDGAFSNCSSINAVNYGNGTQLTRIGEMAFMGCNGLTSFTIPASVTSIGYTAFEGTGWYNDADIAYGQLLYKDGWFLGYKGNNESDKPTGHVTIENGTTHIADEVFYQCSGLTSVAFPASLLSIGYRTFNGCTALTTVYLQRSESPLTALGTEAFYGCTALANIFVPSSVVSTYQVAPDWLSYFSIIYATPNNQFCGDPSVNGGQNVQWTLSGTTLYIFGEGAMADFMPTGDNVQPWHSSLSGGITKVIIGKGITHIGNCAFVGGSLVEDASIPSSVTSIGEYAFSGTGLTSVSLPAGVTKIDNGAFSTCSNMTSATLNSNPSLAINAFPNSATVTMNLPALEGEVGEYWTTFYNKSRNFQVAEGTQIFKVALFDSALQLTELDEDLIVDASSPVILKSSSSGITLTLTRTNSSNDFATHNHLMGVSIASGLTTDGTQYVLNTGEQGVGFYKLASGETIGVGNAYLKEVDATAPDFFLIEEEVEPEENTDPEVVSAQLHIDGDFADWDNVPANLLASASTDANTAFPSLYALKFTADNNYIAFYLEYSASADSVQAIDFLLNTDGNPLTGFNSPDFVNSAANYMIEGLIRWEGESHNFSEASLYQHTGETQTSWDFLELGSNSVSACEEMILPNGHAAIEGAIIKSTFPTPFTSLNIGVFTSDPAWNVSGVLPQATLNNGEVTYSPTLEVPTYNGSFIQVGATSGTCGENLTWELHGDTLLISGTGDMTDYADSNNTPWKHVATNISTLVISDGVTGLGSNAFRDFTALTIVSIPASVVRVGRFAFKGCSSLPTSDGIRYADTYLVGPVDKQQSAYSILEGTRFIGDQAFYNCSYLTAITIPEGVISIGYEAFLHCWLLNNVTLPNSLLHIGDEAFRYCTLPNFTFPSGVISIGKQAFASCFPHDIITIPNSVTSIGEDAFYNAANIIYHGSATGAPWGAKGMNALVEAPFIFADSTRTTLVACLPDSTITEIAVPATVTTIGGYAFDTNKYLQSVTLPESVTSIGEGAFMFCVSLKSIILPSGITSIEDGTFHSCIALESITLPEGLTSIGDEAFYDCIALKSVSFPSSLRSIGENAFSDCTGLTSLVLPEGLTTLGEWAFDHCSSLTSVTIPGSLSVIPSAAFYTCTSLTSVTIGEGVTTVESSAFAVNPESPFHMTSFAFPNSVETIGQWALANCSTLVSLTLGSGLQYLDYEAIQRCYVLQKLICYAPAPPALSPFYDLRGQFPSYTTLYVPAASVAAYQADSKWGQFDIQPIGSLDWSLVDGTLTISGAGSMAEWESNGYPWVSLKDSILRVVIEEGVTSIGEYAFAACNNLTSLVVPNSMTFVSSRAFSGSNHITYVDIPNLSFAYALPTGLQNVIIRGGEVTVEGFDALRDNYSSLRYLDLSGTLNTYMPDGALYDCYRLDTLLLPAGLQMLDYLSIGECVNLRQIALPATMVEVGDRAFENCRHLTTVTFNGNNLTRIGDWAFFQCLQLQNIAIPEGVTEIGDAAFYECDYLNEVSMPASVLRIGDHAFANCTRMTKMTVEAAIPPTVETRTFDEVSRTMPVYVPDASVNTYKADALWGQLNIIGASQEGTSLGNVGSTNTSARKIFVDSKLLIEMPDGSRFDATGKRVK